MKHSTLLYTLCLAGTLFQSSLFAADDAGNVAHKTWQPKGSGEVQGFGKADLGLSAGATGKLLNDGTITSIDDAQVLINKLLPGDFAGGKTGGTYILHVIKWADAAHQTSPVQHWYLYDANSTKDTFTYESGDEVLTRQSLAGRDNFVLISFQISSAPDDTSKDEMSLFLDKATSYTIDIAKQKTQLAANIKTALGLVWPAAGPKLAEAAGRPCFYAAYCVVTVPVSFSTNIVDDLNPFGTAKNAASIVITPANEAKSAKESLTTATYTDEAPSFLGASFAMPVTSYNELNVDQSTGTVTPKSVTRQSLYFTLDFYVPRVESSLMQLCYLPHLFVGVPFSGKPLKRPMGGVAISLKYFEVFYGAVYDMENKNAAGAKNAVWKSVFGVKLPIGSTAKMLGAK